MQNQLSAHIVPSEHREERTGSFTADSSPSRLMMRARRNDHRLVDSLTCLVVKSAHVHAETGKAEVAIRFVGCGTAGCTQRFLLAGVYAARFRRHREKKGDMG